MEEKDFTPEAHSIEIKTLYDRESRFRLSESSQMISFYDLIGFDDRIHPTPHLVTHPIFYHWTSYHARTSTANKTGHVFPSRLKMISNDEDGVIIDNEELIGIQLWKTRCSKPRTDLLMYSVKSNTVTLLKNCIPFLKKHYCDLSYVFLTEQYEKMMEYKFIIFLWIIYYYL